jgi:hypothetical protein
MGWFPVPCYSQIMETNLSISVFELGDDQMGTGCSQRVPFGILIRIKEHTIIIVDY